MNYREQRFYDVRIVGSIEVVNTSNGYLGIHLEKTIFFQEENRLAVHPARKFLMLLEAFRHVNLLSLETNTYGINEQLFVLILINLYYKIAAQYFICRPTFLSRVCVGLYYSSSEFFISHVYHKYLTFIGI